MCCFRNPQKHIALRRNPLIPIKFQFLFGFICLCVFLLVLTSIWQKSGTILIADIVRRCLRQLAGVDVYILKQRFTAHTLMTTFPFLCPLSTYL